jgi:hypothetical protein
MSLMVIVGMVDKPGMIRTQVGCTVDQKWFAVLWDALYDTSP